MTPAEHLLKKNMQSMKPTKKDLNLKDIHEYDLINVNSVNILKDLDEEKKTQLGDLTSINIDRQ